MATNPVITQQQARAITGGRTPLVPVEYEQAVTALQACISLDETKYWDAKADALAAWARIYRNDDAGRKAKMLKIHAYRRMGLLAQELNPRRSTAATGGRGSVPGSGPRSLLLQNGLTVAQADAARVISKLPERSFNKLLKNPVSPTTARHQLRDNTVWHQMQAAAMSLRSRCRANTPAQVVATLTDTEKANAKQLVTEITEWLDEFVIRLGKSK
jgi:hypothetical protein